MLVQLEINHFAIIDHSILNFNDGFHVISGETGSGKSILLDALHALIGERTSKDFVRKGEEKAVLKAVFLKTKSLEEKLLLKGISIEDDVVIVKREIYKTGRSIAKVNGSIQTIQTIRDICGELVEICGQREHILLSDESTYLSIIDQQLNDKEKSEVRSYTDLFKEYKTICEKLDQLQNRHREQEQLLDLYRYQKQEIESSSLQENEDESLEEEKVKLSSFDKISRSVSAAIYSLENINHISQGSYELKQIVRLENSFENLIERLDNAFYEIEDVRSELENYISSFEYDEQRLNDIMNRIDLINNLKRKYGDTIPDILLHYEEVSSKLDEIENKDGLVEQLSTEKDNLHKKLTALSSNITKYRMNVAHQLELAIVSELKQLYMPDARFSFSFDTSEEFLLTGVDKVSILFNANKGEDLKPLAKIASGGEMSRVLLAIKMATNQKNLKETLIFDEVDEGVGGEVGRVIGEKLSQLGNATQIVVISHLPQVAAKANEHFLIEKRTVDERTVSSVRKLAHEERIDEIARMIYGDEKNEITRKQAEEMLKK